MKMLFKIVCLLLVVSMFSGCASYVALNRNTRATALRRAEAMGDEAAVRAIRLGDNGAGVGIDVSSLDAIFDSPQNFLIQLGAAAIDAALVRGGLHFRRKKNRLGMTTPWCVRI